MFFGQPGGNLRCEMLLVDIAMEALIVMCESLSYLQIALFKLIKVCSNQPITCTALINGVSATVEAPYGEFCRGRTSPPDLHHGPINRFEHSQSNL